jgi:predicted double-glycine peptidase
MICRRTRTTYHGRLIMALLLGALGIGNALAAELTEQKVPFHNWTALRSRGVVLQKLDFSCGAASVATLATFFLGKPTTEETALRIIRARYTPEEWKKKKQDGLSMEDLAYIAEQLGFQAQGGRLGLAALLKLNGPVIVHFNKGEFQHFSVLRGIHGMTVFLADPVFGSVSMSLGLFLDQFTGNALAVWDPKSPVASEYSLKLKEGDNRDGIYATMHPSFYDRPQPMGPGF